MIKQTKFKWKTINGLKQVPKCTDFHITPVLTFARASEPLGHAWGISLEWGHWAAGFCVLTVYKPLPQNMPLWTLN